jgi:uncharacterized protein YjbJ (UPF0337 family)
MGELWDKLKGRVKQGAGRVSGNRSLEAEGNVDEGKGRMKGAFEDAKRAVKDAVDPDRTPPRRI